MQAKTQLLAISKVLPGVKEVKVLQIGQVAQLARDAAGELVVVEGKHADTISDAGYPVLNQAADYALCFGTNGPPETNYSYVKNFTKKNYTKNQQITLAEKQFTTQIF